LEFAKAEIEDRGGDHRVLLLDREYVFRFPRRSDSNLRMEIAVLAALQGKCGIPTPSYQFVAPDRSFAGYRFLDGEELTSALFASLPPAVQGLVLDQAIQLVNALHTLDPDQIAQQSAWRKIWAPHQFAARGRSRLKPVELRFPKLGQAILEFYERYETDVSPVNLVLHGDLVEDHLLLSPAQNALAGVLDFGDVGLGDPADDLKGFWAYGTAAAHHVVKNSFCVANDPGLLERSHRAYLRYRIDRFVEHMKDAGVGPSTVIDADTLYNLLTMSEA
jgi:aminoglycoside 2''-phosphotransferase